MEDAVEFLLSLSTRDNQMQDYPNEIVSQQAMKEIHHDGDGPVEGMESEEYGKYFRRSWAHGKGCCL